MVEIETIIISALVGFTCSAILVWLRDIFVFKRQVEYKSKKELIEKRLKYLYSPLYFYIIRSEEQCGKSCITWGAPVGTVGEGREKEFLDKTMEKYSHLASVELQRFLAKIHSAGAYQEMKDGELEKMMNLIKKEYNELKEELFDTKYQL